VKTDQEIEIKKGGIKMIYYEDLKNLKGRTVYTLDTTPWSAYCTDLKTGERMHILSKQILLKQRLNSYQIYEIDEQGNFIALERDLTEQEHKILHY